jgi:AraC family transcriptional regulator, regulatory protein of adaptative response / methylated-DNA-[protein]-cysteine methyltransferase
MHSQDFHRIERAMQYMEHHYREQPSLDELAASVNLSRYHFQRLFTRWAGISPGRFLHCLALQHAKGLLAERQSLLDAALETGLSGPGRLHDLFVTYEALTPGQYKRQGEGLRIAYGLHPTPFGSCLLALSERGICALSFVDAGGRAAALAELGARLPRATLHEDAARTAPLVQRVFGAAPGAGEPLHLLLLGTNFQVKVWEALLRIPAGACATYQDVAEGIGQPRAMRAVGQAAARNPIAYLIPCHRVIRKLGLAGGYRWGQERKRLLLAWEAARNQPEPAAAASA